MAAHTRLSNEIHFYKDGLTCFHKLFLFFPRFLSDEMSLCFEKMIMIQIRYDNERGLSSEKITNVMGI